MDTAKRSSENIELLSTVFKTPVGKAHRNTFGLMSPVEEESGTLGRAFTYRLHCEGFESHPDTGARIVGFKLPYWKEAVRLALHAHRLFPNYVFIGWDVAISEEGPLILEGNQCWDTLTMQRPGGIPLGHTRFAEICREYLEP